MGSTKKDKVELKMRISQPKTKEAKQIDARNITYQVELTMPRGLGKARMCVQGKIHMHFHIIILFLVPIALAFIKGIMAINFIGVALVAIIFDDSMDTTHSIRQQISQGFIPCNGATDNAHNVGTVVIKLPGDWVEDEGMRMV